MNIPIEVLMIGIILLIVLIWTVWFNISGKRAIKKYTPDKNKSRPGGIDISKNDKGRKQETSIVVGRREDGEDGVGESDNAEPIGFAGPDILETAGSLLSDTNRQRLRGIFGKRSRR